MCFKKYYYECFLPNAYYMKTTQAQHSYNTITKKHAPTSMHPPDSNLTTTTQQQNPYIPIQQTHKITITSM